MQNIEIILTVLGVIIIPTAGALIKVLNDFTTMKNKMEDIIEDMKEQKQEVALNKTVLQSLGTDHKILEGTLDSTIKTIQATLGELSADVKQLLKERA